MKATKILYWTSTSLIAIMMLYTAYAYLANPALAQAFQHLGFPGYFRVELAVAKIAGAILLLAPVATRIKEWVYAGFAFTFVSAFIAHSVSGDPVVARVMVLVFLSVLLVSYISYNKLAGTTGAKLPATAHS